MKRLKIVLWLLLLALLFSQRINAYDYEYEGIYYNLDTQSRSAEVTSISYKYTGYTGEVVIPEKVTYEGVVFNVTSIGEAAFWGCSWLTSVTIPNSVTSIGSYAFEYCSGLTSVTIPNSVTSIGWGAFVYCSGLTSIKVEDGNTKYDSRDNCNAIIETESNTLISGCMTTVIPNSVTSIGDIAFYGCSGLTFVTIPNSMTSIGYGAFGYCSDLTSVTIPNSVTSIGDIAFNGCSGLTSIKVEDGNTKYDSRDNCNAIIETESNTLISGCMTTVIPNSVTSIGDISFSGCSGLTFVTIPNSVTSIGLGAFQECESLTSVTIPNSVTSIGLGAFQECESLTSVTIPKSVTSIGDYAFRNCNALTSVISEIKNPFGIRGNVFETKDDIIYSNATLTVPTGTMAVYQSTDGWQNFRNIVETTSMEPIQTIHVAKAGTLSDYIDDYSKNFIENLTLTGSLNGTDFRLLREMAGRDVRGGITDGSLKVLDISGARVVSGGSRYFDIPGGIHFSIDNNDIVPEYVFHDCRLIEIALPNSAKVIEDEAFENCAVLRTVTLPEKLTTIGEEAFNGCKRIDAITIPSSVTSIGARAFGECTELTYIRSQIVSPFAISDNTFSSTTYNNARLIVPQNTLSAYKSKGGWKKFNNIAEFITSENITLNGVEYHCNFEDLSATVVKVNKSLKDVRIPTTVKGKSVEYTINTISDYAFNGCDLNYLSLPSTITAVSDDVFAGCKICAMTWNAESELSPSAFKNTNMSTKKNFLLYVKSASWVPHTVRNVIVNDYAESITLSDDGDKFYCPTSFRAKKISFTHHFGMETGGTGKGWETIVLPFDVQKITHSTNGEIIPFMNWSKGSDKRPFWLYRWTSNGTGENFTKAGSILANTAYLIAMPNQTGYESSYILSGDVTFSAENALVERTSEYSGTFVPTYAPVQKSSSIYALNVINSYVSITGGHEAGSCFISNLRDIRPFEAYIKQGSSTRSIFEINTDNTTDLDDIMQDASSTNPIAVYTLSGQHVGTFTQSLLSGLPKGVYIVNGKKIIK